MALISVTPTFHSWNLLFLLHYTHYLGHAHTHTHTHTRDLFLHFEIEKLAFKTQVRRFQTSEPYYNITQLDQNQLSDFVINESDWIWLWRIISQLGSCKSLRRLKPFGFLEFSDPKSMKYKTGCFWEVSETQCPKLKPNFASFGTFWEFLGLKIGVWSLPKTDHFRIVQLTRRNLSFHLYTFFRFSAIFTGYNFVTKFCQFSQTWALNNVSLWCFKLFLSPKKFSIHIWCPKKEFLYSKSKILLD
jgi:hypothetical protein